MPSPDDYKLLHHKSHSPGSWRGALFLSSAPPVPNRCGKTWQRPSCNCPKMLLPTFTLPAHLTPVIPIRCLTGICRRSEEHTSELQSLMRISYAVFCLKKKKLKKENKNYNNSNTTHINDYKYKPYIKINKGNKIMTTFHLVSHKSSTINRKDITTYMLETQ